MDFTFGYRFFNTPKGASSGGFGGFSFNYYFVGMGLNVNIQQRFPFSKKSDELKIRPSASMFLELHLPIYIFDLDFALMPYLRAGLGPHYGTLYGRESGDFFKDIFNFQISTGLKFTIGTDTKYVIIDLGFVTTKHYTSKEKLWIKGFDLGIGMGL